MKTHIRILTVAVALCVGLFTATAADKDGHNHKVTPKGGRLLEKTEPHAEFVVEKDRSVTINFYNEAMKPVPAAAQAVIVIADAKDGKAKLEFEKRVRGSVAAKIATPSRPSHRPRFTWAEGVAVAEGEAAIGVTVAWAAP